MGRLDGLTRNKSEVAGWLAGWLARWLAVDLCLSSTHYKTVRWVAQAVTCSMYFVYRIHVVCS